MLSKSRRPQWSKPPGLPCRRSRRQSDTIPSCTGVPSANRRQEWRRGPHDCALHLNPPPTPVEQAARLAMPAVTPAEPHNPERYGSPNRHPPPRLAAWPAGLRAPPQPAAPRRGRPSCPPPSSTSVSSVSSVVLRVLRPPCPPWFVFLRVLRVLCGLPSPCSLWFAFSVPSPPPVTTFPKSFSLSFSTTSQLPLSPSLAPLLYVESERCG
jgi:hypothetical protein